MKQVSFPALSSIPVLRLAICALLVIGGGPSLSARESDSAGPFATSGANGGRLIINRSPSLGHNVSITLTIDGKQAGILTRGRTYDRYLTPGRHNIVANPSRSRGTWHGALNVRAGETYTYTASYAVNELVLTPATPSR